MPAACWAFCFHRNSQLGCNLTKAPPHCLIISEIMIWRRGCSCSSPPPPDRIYWRTASSSPALAPNNRGPRFLIVRPLATAGLPHPCGLTLGVPSNQDSNIVSSRGESGVPRAMFALFGLLPFHLSHVHDKDCGVSHCVPPRRVLSRSSAAVATEGRTEPEVSQSL